MVKTRITENQYTLTRTIKTSDYVRAGKRAENSKHCQMVFYRVEILQGKIKSVKNLKNTLKYNRSKKIRITKNGCLY